MTRSLPQAFAAFASLMLVSMTWVPTLAMPQAAPAFAAAPAPVAATALAGTVRIVALA
ncbi:MAG: hypothetical protein KGM17_07230 [Sphingomonadales bacterium]|nr:hypothetical protein [Sphingomonadales bacterium]